MVDHGPYSTPHTMIGLDPRPRASASRGSFAGRRAFTLLELLVALGMLAFLLSLLLPGLSAARERARMTVCASNVRQLALANGYYAEDQSGNLTPGAADFLLNLHRWHGTRDQVGRPFDVRRGPLVPYLGTDALIRQCPTFPAAVLAEEQGGFERGNGGYGYNNAYLGVQLTRHSTGEFTVRDDRSGAAVRFIRRPADTLMFADAAFAANRLIEYSFVEPRFQPAFPTFRMDPSIHFRHRGQANTAWCDGRVEPRRLSLTWSSGLYRTPPQRHNIGWFGTADDNGLFDLD